MASSPRQVLAPLSRNGRLLRLLGASALFTVSEYAVWIAVLVYAYAQGGATQAGMVSVAQLAPAAVVAPLAARLADRWSPGALLVGGYAAQATAAVTTTLLLYADAPPMAVYGGAVVLSSLMTTTRPAQAAILPALTFEVAELTVANGALGWIESLSIMLAGAVTGVVLGLAGVTEVWAVTSLLLAVAASLVVPLRHVGAAPPGAARRVDQPDDEPGLAQLFRDAPVRLLVGLQAAEFLVVGALDVLFVVLALDVLHAGDAWAGYLNMAYGAGGVLLGTLAAFMIGRRLGPVLAVTAVVLGVALTITASTHNHALVVALLALVGGSRALFDVAARALLQRTVPGGRIARVFGVVEGLNMAGMALGALLAPVLVALGGAALALWGIAVVLPLLVLLRSRALLGLDDHAQVPVVELALLRSLRIFRGLPGPALEGVARALEPAVYAAGSTLLVEGDVGNCYLAIADGQVQISRNGEIVRRVGRGDGLGEIALLRTGLRTATATAITPVRAFRLDRVPFLTALAGHAPTLASARGLVRNTQEADSQRDVAPED